MPMSSVSLASYPACAIDHRRARRRRPPSPNLPSPRRHSPRDRAPEPEQPRDVRVRIERRPDAPIDRDEQRRNPWPMAGNMAIRMHHDAHRERLAAEARPVPSIERANGHKIAEPQRAEPKPPHHLRVRQLDIDVAEHAVRAA